MSHNYLFDTHAYLRREQAILEQALETLTPETEDWYVQKGRLQALAVFKDYICTHVNPKLPKRLLRQLTRGSH